MFLSNVIYRQIVLKLEKRIYIKHNSKDILLNTLPQNKKITNKNIYLMINERQDEIRTSHPSVKLFGD